MPVEVTLLCRVLQILAFIYLALYPIIWPKPESTPPTRLNSRTGSNSADAHNPEIRREPRIRLLLSPWPLRLFWPTIVLVIVIILSTEVALELARDRREQELRQRNDDLLVQVSNQMALLAARAGPPTDRATGTAIPEGGIVIAKPANGAEVDTRATVEGRVDAVDRDFWIVVCPANLNDCWVQPEPVVEPDGSFHLVAYFGRPQDHELSYEIRAIRAMPEELSVGSIIPLSLAFEHSAALVTVTRQ